MPGTAIGIIACRRISGRSQSKARLPRVFSSQYAPAKVSSGPKSAHQAAIFRLLG